MMDNIVSQKPELATLSFTLYGEPASKSNQRRLVSHKGKPRFIKSKKAINYVMAVRMQLAHRNIIIFPKDIDVAVTMKIYYASRRPDLDESVILDALQNIVYVNDRQVKEKHIYWGLDKHEPRCEIEIRSIVVGTGGLTRNA
jgi:Holliday junction resolvase RusA-like endonuclease